MKELLQNLMLVYAKAVRMLPITDPLRVQLRDLILNCFSHDGFAAIRDFEANQAPTQQQRSQTGPGGKEMRRFAHPDAKPAKDKTKPDPVVDQEGDSVEGTFEVDKLKADFRKDALGLVATALGALASNENNTQAAQPSEQPVPAPETIAAVTDQPVPAPETIVAVTDQPVPEQGEPKTPTKVEGLGKPSGNDENPASKSETKTKPVVFDLDELVSMKPKAIAEKYGLGPLTELAQKQGIEVRTGASATQIAAAILTKLKAQ